MRYEGKGRTHDSGYPWANELRPAYLARFPTTDDLVREPGHMSVWRSSFSQ